MPTLNPPTRQPDSLFHAAGKGVQRMQPGRMIAAGHYPNLPTASIDFVGAHAVTADGDWVCQKVDGNYVWVPAGASPILESSLTIASDAVTLPTIPTYVSLVRLTVDTEAAAATDALATVTVTGEVAEGTLLMIKRRSGGSDVALRDQPDREVL